MRPSRTRGDRRLRQRVGIDVPLLGETRLDRNAATVAMRNHVLVRLDLVEQAGLFEDLHDYLAGGEAILTLEAIPSAVKGADYRDEKSCSP